MLEFLRRRCVFGDGSGILLGHLRNVLDVLGNFGTRRALFAQGYRDVGNRFDNLRSVPLDLRHRIAGLSGERDTFVHTIDAIAHRRHGVLRAILDRTDHR